MTRKCPYRKIVGGSCKIAGNKASEFQEIFIGGLTGIRKLEDGVFGEADAGRGISYLATWPVISFIAA
jgi:hypothetical protein